jgi:hypothetical protein
VRVKKGEKMGLSLFVNRRLEVQFLSPAPPKPSVDPARGSDHPTSFFSPLSLLSLAFHARYRLLHASDTTRRIPPEPVLD